MSEPNKNSSILGDAFLEAIRQAVREEIQREMNRDGYKSNKPMEMAETVKPYLTIREAANISRLGQSTIRVYIRKRELRACQVGSRVIIKRTDLEQFLEAHPIEILPD